MNKFSYLVFISFFSYAITPDKFESLCGGVKYEINSNCKINDLRYDQDKLDIPICEGQILSTQGEKIELSQMTGFVERLNNNGKKIRMMNFVFYGFSCKKDRVILSASGGCNSCGELFKEFDLSGKEIKDDSESVDLEPMKNIIPEFFRVE